MRVALLTVLVLVALPVYGQDRPEDRIVLEPVYEMKALEQARIMASKRLEKALREAREQDIPLTAANVEELRLAFERMSLVFTRKIAKISVLVRGRKLPESAVTSICMDLAKAEKAGRVKDGDAALRAFVKAWLVEFDKSPEQKAKEKAAAAANKEAADKRDAQERERRRAEEEAARRADEEKKRRAAKANEARKKFEEERRANNAARRRRAVAEAEAQRRADEAEKKRLAHPARLAAIELVFERLRGRVEKIGATIKAPPNPVFKVGRELAEKEVDGKIKPADLSDMLIELMIKQEMARRP